MEKRLDWKAAEARARRMTDAELRGARTDARKTAEIWDEAPELDADCNGSYYRDEASVYAREQERRRKLRKSDGAARVEAILGVFDEARKR